MDEIQDNKNEEPSCCQANNKKESKGILSGIIYGLIPHTGCIAFILFTILGVSTATALFKPLLMNKYFFYFLILLSFVFATISAVIYLTKNGMLSSEGLKRKWKYIFILYGTTIGVNILLFLVIFPLAANIATATPTGDVIKEDLSELTLKVAIPCPGHSPLISQELRTLPGISSIQFRFPSYFDVRYDNGKTTKQQILGLTVFNEYKAEVVSGNNLPDGDKLTSATSGESNQKTGCGCGGCSGACGGSCSASI